MCTLESGRESLRAREQESEMQARKLGSEKAGERSRKQARERGSERGSLGASDRGSEREGWKEEKGTKEMKVMTIKKRKKER